MTELKAKRKGDTLDSPRKNNEDTATTSVRPDKGNPQFPKTTKKTDENSCELTQTGLPPHISTFDQTVVADESAEPLSEVPEVKKSAGVKDEVNFDFVKMPFRPTARTMFLPYIFLPHF